jgi:hypothetical protein
MNERRRVDPYFSQAERERKMALIFAAIVILVLAGVDAWRGAHAQCTQLTYVGAPFASVTATASNGAANNGLPVYSPLTGVVTLSAALPANASNFTVTPASWSFTEPAVYTPFMVSGAAAPFAAQTATFTFSTDANGNITAWNISIYYETESPLWISTVASSQAGDTVEIQFNDAASPLGQVTTTGSSTSGGTWTCPTTFSANYTDPPVAPVANPLQAQVTALTAQVATLTAQLATANAQSVTLSSQLTASKSEVTTQSTQLATDTSTITSLNSKITTLQTELTAAQKSTSSTSSTATASVVDPLTPAKSGGGAFGIEELAGLAVLVMLKRPKANHVPNG